MSFSVSYSSNIVCITPRLDAILSEKSGRGFSRFWFRGIKASAEERDITICRRQEVFIFGVRSVLGVRNVHGSHPGILSHKFHYFIKYFLISFERIRGGGAYFDAGSPLAVVSENFVRISMITPPCFWLRQLFENAVSTYTNRALWYKCVWVLIAYGREYFKWKHNGKQLNSKFYRCHFAMEFQNLSF